MASFFRRLGRAAKATLEAHDEARFKVCGDLVVCPVCRGEDFVRVPDRSVPRPLFMRLNLPLLKLKGHATTLICTHCTHLLSFGYPPEQIDEDEDL